MAGAFNLGRVFKHKWSVNFKCRASASWLMLGVRWVPCEPVPNPSLLVDCAGPFSSGQFALLLLGLHLGTLLLFAHYKWCKKQGGLFRVVLSGLAGRPIERLSTCEMLEIVLSCNFIGVAFARSLHFQFYVWYFHSLLLLLACSRLPHWVWPVLLFAIEACWNPWHGESSSVGSSLLLSGCHLLLLLALWIGPPEQPPEQLKQE